MNGFSIVGTALATGQSTEAGDTPHGGASLIPRELLFGNPERVGVKISPDGSKLSYLSPLNGVLNIWVMPVDGTAARPVTQSTDRPIKAYMWAENSEQLIYSSDTGGNEDTHVFVVGREVRLSLVDALARPTLHYSQLGKQVHPVALRLRVWYYLRGC